MNARHLPPLADALHAPPAETSALTADMARMFRHLGVVSFRASVVDIDSMAFHNGWTISANGEVSDSAFDQPVDSAFPARRPPSRGSAPRPSMTPWCSA